MSKAKEAAKGLFKGSTWKAAVKEDSMDWSETTAQFVVDTVAGIAGGAAGNLFGPFAMIPAVPLNVIANKTGHRWLRAASIGMIASGFEDSVSAHKTADTGFNLKNEFADGK